MNMIDNNRMKSKHVHRQKKKDSFYLSITLATTAASWMTATENDVTSDDLGAGFELDRLFRICDDSSTL